MNSEQSEQEWTIDMINPMMLMPFEIFGYDDQKRSDVTQ